jgi:polyphosphate kinase
MESGVLRRYCHIGTGNYNPKTARIYEDLGILTADPRVGADLTDLFNTLTGYSRQTTYRSLMVAPHGIRAGLLEKIRREARHAGEGKPAGIRIKVNSLVDEQLIDALYDASLAGVPVDLVIRGICTLRPGVPGLSENIRVRSIVGRFLEHSRVISFTNGGTPEWWLGSSDLMHRNLDRRVEVLLRVNDASAARQLQRVLDLDMAPDVRSWQLAGDGSWSRTGTRDSQAELLATRGENAG